MVNRHEYIERYEIRPLHPEMLTSKKKGKFHTEEMILSNNFPILTVYLS